MVGQWTWRNGHGFVVQRAFPEHTNLKNRFCSTTIAGTHCDHLIWSLRLIGKFRTYENEMGCVCVCMYVYVLVKSTHSLCFVIMTVVAAVHRLFRPNRLTIEGYAETYRIEGVTNDNMRTPRSQM